MSVEPPGLTRDLERSMSIDQWRASVGEVHTRLSFDVEHGSPFRGVRAATALGDLRACRFSGSAVTARRTKRDVAQSHGGETILLWQISGRSRVVQRDREVDLLPGHLTFLDLERPYAVECSDGFGQMVIHIRADDLRDRLRRTGVTRDFLVRLISPRGYALPWLAFLSTALLQSQESPGGADALYDACVGALGELAALATEIDGPPTPEEQLRRSVMASLQRSHWREDLTVDVMAREHGVSRRTVFRAFKAVGESFSGTLQELRLVAAAHMLERADSSLTVEGVARAVGYAAPSSFHARFVERYGQTPGAYRRDRIAEPEPALRRRTPGT